MPYFIVFTVYGIVAAALQNTWFSGPLVYGLRLNLFIPFLLYAGVNLEWKQAMPMLLLFGLLFDLPTNAPMLLTPFGFFIVYAMVRFVMIFITIQGWPARFFWLSITSFVEGGLKSFFISVWSGNDYWLKFFLKHAIPQSLLDALVGVFIIEFFFFLSRFTTMLRSEKTW